MTWDALRRLGRDHDEALRSTLAERVASTAPDGHRHHRLHVRDDGTAQGRGPDPRQPHGRPGLLEADHARRAQWVHLLFLPLAHSFARLESFLGVRTGLTTAFAENIDKRPENLREVRPHFICSVPRVFEKVYARILAGVEAGSPAKRRIFRWAAGRRARGEPPAAAAASPCPAGWS